MVEIERLVTGDLNKSIEQCVTLLMDVERKVHVLKNELAQTLNQLPGNRLATTGFAPGIPQAPQGFAPTPFLGGWPVQGPVSEAPQGRVGFVPYAYHQGSWSPFGTWANYGLPIAREGVGHGIVPGYATPGSIPFQGVPIQALPGFTALPQGIAPVSPMPGYGYIW